MALDTVLAVLTAEGPILADPAIPLLTSDDRAVLLGESAFETLLVSQRTPVLLTEHLERLKRSGAALSIEVPADADLLALVTLGVENFGGDSAAVRLVVTPGSSERRGVTFVRVYEIPSRHLDTRHAGIAAITLSLGIPAGLRAAAPWLLGGVKSGSYAVSAAGLREAQRRGADDAIWLSSDGEVLEGTTSAIAWVRAGQLLTVPASEVGVLPSVTWELVSRLSQGLGLPTATRRARIDEIRGADEVMLLSSVRGIAPVITIDQRRVGDGAPGAVTRGLQKALDSWLDDPARSSS